MVKVKFKKLHEGAKLPVKAHENDFCYDVFATSIEDLGNNRIKYGLGFGLQIDTDFKDSFTTISHELRARSSIHKTGLILSNSIGTIDEDYTGEISAVFYNVIKELPNYEVGDRIAQICLQVSIKEDFEIVEEFNETVRGSSGYGSTGKN